MACMRCVFPKPVPPYRNKGLYARPGDSATAFAAACAKRFPDPMTNLSKVYRGLKPLKERMAFIFFLETGWLSVSVATSIAAGGGAS